MHVVMTATGYDGARVRDQVKANCTRALRENRPVFRNRPVWTVGGDWKCINTEDDLTLAVSYVADAQSRKARDAMT